MDVQKTLTELRAELERLNESIAALEQVAAIGQKRRGRPPKWLSEARKAKAKQKKGVTNIHRRMGRNIRGDSDMLRQYTYITRISNR